jgi:hypothetical protein
MFRVLIQEDEGGSREEVVTSDEVTIGRVAGNDIVLPTGNVSKRHARVAIEGRDVLVYDLRSTNGTLVAGQRVVQPTLYQPGDVIRVGEFSLTLLEVRRTRTPSTIQVAQPAERREGAGRATLNALPVRPSGASLDPGMPLMPSLVAPSAASPPSVPAAEPVAAPAVPRVPPPLPPRPAQSTGATPPVSRPPAPAAARTVPGDTAPAEGTVRTRRPHVTDAAESPAGLSALTPPPVHPDAQPTERLSRVPRETWWANPDVGALWVQAGARLLEEVPVEGLPTIMAHGPAAYRPFVEMGIALVRELAPGWSDERQSALGMVLGHLAVGLGPIESYAADPRVSAIAVQGDGSVTLTLELGQQERAPLGIPAGPLTGRVLERMEQLVAQRYWQGMAVAAATWEVQGAVQGQAELRRRMLPPPGLAAASTAWLMDVEAIWQRAGTVLCLLDPGLHAATSLAAVFGATDAWRGALLVGTEGSARALGTACIPPAALAHAALRLPLLVVHAWEPGALGAWWQHRRWSLSPTLLCIPATDLDEAALRFSLCGQPDVVLRPADCVRACQRVLRVQGDAAGHVLTPLDPQETFPHG